jgi:hypothetical protein
MHIPHHRPEAANVAAAVFRGARSAFHVSTVVVLRNSNLASYVSALSSSAFRAGALTAPTAGVASPTETHAAPDLGRVPDEPDLHENLESSTSYPFRGLPTRFTAKRKSSDGSRDRNE